ncbi:MAG: type II secretion system F family protein, partial [Candidatus Omnitrophota bacterium]
MPKFTYSAKKGPQEKVSGVIDAKGRSQAAAIIEEKGLFPISIEEINDGKSAGMGVFSVKRVRLKDLTIFTRQFSNLIESGLTIAQALNIIIKQAGNPVLKNILFDIGERIKDGSTFSDALSAHPGQFSQYYCAVIRAGEISGSLETVLTRLADFSEQEERTRSDILSALTYPALIVGVGFVTIYALLVYAVPQLTSMFEAAGEALPLPTQLLINLSSALRNYWWLLLLFSGAVFFIIKQEKSQNEKYFWDKLLLGIPLAGKIILKSEMAHFARILSLLMESGVSIMVALDVVNNTIVNNVIKSE